MYRGLLVGLFGAGVVVLVVAGSAHGGVDSESNTDGYNPAAELYNIAESQRLGKVARHLALQEMMIYSTGYWPGDLWGPPSGGPPIRQPIGYESKQVGPNRWIYRPLYDEDIGPDGKPLPLGVEQLPAPDPAAEPQDKPGANPRLPAPSDARPEDYVPPDDARRRPGPRAF